VNAIMTDVLSNFLVWLAIFGISRLWLFFQAHRMLLTLSACCQMASIVIVVLMVLGDNLGWPPKTQIDFALLNLVVNAIKFLSYKGAPTRWDIVCDVLIPVVIVILAIPGVGFRLILNMRIDYQ